MTYDEAKEMLLATVIPHECVGCQRRAVIPEHTAHFCPCGELLLVLVSAQIVAKARKLSQEWTGDFQELEANFHPDLFHDDDDAAADLP